jgi:preprotein translocase subunit Sss1
MISLFQENVKESKRVCKKCKDSYRPSREGEIVINSLKISKKR